MLFTASSFDAAAHARQNRDGSGSNELQAGADFEGLPPGDYKFFVCSSSALAAPASAHIVGFDMGGAGNHFITSFEIWTDEAISEVTWMVVK